MGGGCLKALLSIKNVWILCSHALTWQVFHIDFFKSQPVVDYKSVVYKKACNIAF